MAQNEPPALIVEDEDAWRKWLIDNDSSSDGVWLRLAKRHTTSPTSLTYQEALAEALCSGWIDGQRRSVDADTFQQRFTPRRAKSTWSQRNVELVGQLIEQGRIRARGLVEIERAQEDGRWERAYPGQATAQIPDELAEALAGSPAANVAFTGLTRADRYQLLHPIITATTPGLRARRIANVIAKLETSVP